MANEEKVEKIYLNEFLGMFSLSRAQVLRYTKIYKPFEGNQKSKKEWSKLTGLELKELKSKE